MVTGLGKQITDDEKKRKSPKKKRWHFSRDTFQAFKPNRPTGISLFCLGGIATPPEWNNSSKHVTLPPKIRQLSITLSWHSPILKPAGGERPSPLDPKPSALDLKPSALTIREQRFSPFQATQ